MNCPSCGALVEDGADLCLECGEPMGDSPAARVARSEAAAPAPAGGEVIIPPAGTFKDAPPVAAPARSAAPTVAAPARSAAPPVAAKPAYKKWRNEEPEPIRCPGCGLKTLAVRCPSCGNRVRPDDD